MTLDDIPPEDRQRYKVVRTDQYTDVPGRVVSADEQSGVCVMDGTRILLTDGKFVATGAWREIGYRGPFVWDIDGERGDECPWANDYMGDVVAWMPLPAPPTTGEE